MDVENEYWRQRSQSNWLTNGDGNTSYFYHHVNYRRRFNHIAKIRDNEGRVAATHDAISTNGTGFY